MPITPTPKGWRTSFGLTSAKLQQISLERKEKGKKNILDSRKVRFVVVMY